MSEPATSEENEMEARLAYLDEALESGRMRRLKPMLHALHPAEIALLLESVPRAKREVVWSLVPEEDHGETLLHVNDEVRSELIEAMDHSVLLAADTAAACAPDPDRRHVRLPHARQDLRLVEVQKEHAVVV